MKTKEILKNITMSQLIINILVGISTANLTLLLIQYEYLNDLKILLLSILSFIVIEIVIAKYNFLNILKNSKKALLIISTILGIFTSYMITVYNRYPFKKELVYLIAIISVPATILFLYYFYNKLGYMAEKYIKSMDKVEKWYVVISIIIITVGISVVYNMTDVFYTANLKEPKVVCYSADGKEIIDSTDIKDKKIVNFLKEYVDNRNKFDIVYTTDTALIYLENTYSNINSSHNDLKQPLFGIFSLPFNIVPKLVSMILPKIPNLNAMLVAIVQGIMIIIAFTLLARMLKLNGISKTIFLLFITFSYSTLLFVINLEQYVIPVFYLILFIYLVILDKKDKDLAYIAATGSILTSGIFFPLLGKRKNFSKSIKNIFFTFLKCMTIFIVSAKIIYILPGILEDKAKNNIEQFVGDGQVTINDKWNMYTNFVCNTMYYTETTIKDKFYCTPPIQIDDENILAISKTKRILQANTTKTNVVGILMITLVIISCFLNRKDKFSIITSFWCIFSFILIFVFGWGVKEDGLILYTFYFSWAFICSIFKLFEKMLYKHKKLKYILGTTILLPTIAINLYGMYQTISFGIQYFNI